MTAVLRQKYTVQIRVIVITWLLSSLKSSWLLFTMLSPFLQPILRDTVYSYYTFSSLSVSLRTGDEEWS